MPSIRSRFSSFNGAGAFQHRRLAENFRPLVTGCALQWGRCVSAPETVAQPQTALPLTAASMGPVRFSTGDRSRHKSQAANKLRGQFREVAVHAGFQGPC